MTDGIKPRIAILEDHEDTRELLRILLEDEFTVQEFRTAAELLAALELEKFDVIIADIMLPDLDGYDFIRALRADARFKDLPVIAVTALAMASDREKAMGMGFTDYLVKPLEGTQLKLMIWRSLNGTTSGSSPRST
jgi:CheY-like chemotaxis protein